MPVITDLQQTLTTPAPWTLLARAYGGPPVSGKLRAAVEDFVVEEELGFAPDGSGQHLLLLVEKRGLNTDDLARELARLAGIRPRDVGYCGRKDRWALARQWFSVPAGSEPLWPSAGTGSWRVIEQARHGRKLRRGSHRYNRFTIAVRSLHGDTGGLEARLRRIGDAGVPNYFGEQRFGRGGANLARAHQMFETGAAPRDRSRRGLYLSAARAWLFNCVLSARVADASWDRLLPGDAASLDGSASYFSVTNVDETLLARLANGDIHPSGPMWGAGAPVVSGTADELERSVAEQYQLWVDSLATAGLKQERRALRLPVIDLDWEIGAARLDLTMRLRRGCFATSVLREVVDYIDAGQGAGEP